jgi:hypothetical protein
MTIRSVSGFRCRCAVSLFICLSLVALVSGCGKSRPEIKNKLPLFPVTGKVVMDGQPMVGATIIFNPVTPFPEKSAPQLPHAVVGDDGSFTASTYQKDDGAPAGDYKITVSWRGNVEGLSNEQKDDLPEKAPDSMQTPRTSKIRVKIKEQPNALATWDLTEQQASNTP